MPELVRDFLDPADFYQQVKAVCGIDFYCGVPDSLLKGKPKEREREKKTLIELANSIQISVLMLHKTFRRLIISLQRMKVQLLDLPVVRTWPQVDPR